MEKTIKKIPNGGFPPIKYCNNTKTKTKTQNKEVSKERLFAPPKLDIFSSKKIKPLISDINNTDGLNDLTEINELY